MFCMAYMSNGSQSCWRECEAQTEREARKEVDQRYKEASPDGILMISVVDDAGEERVVLAKRRNAPGAEWFGFFE